MDRAQWETSPVSTAVKEIFASEGLPFKMEIKAILHTVDEDYQVYRVLSEEIIRDYCVSMMEDTRLTCLMPLGDYIYLLYPNKDNLEMTLRRSPIKSIGLGTDNTREINQVRYKCIMEPDNPSFSSGELAGYSQSALNNMDFVTFRVRLMDRNVEPLRVKLTQGIFRGIAPSKMIKSILLYESQQILVDGKPAVAGIDMVKPDNDKPVVQIILPSGTHICEVPTFIQENFDGIYKYGIGTFYQRYRDNTPLWFVYPLFDFDRFDGGEERDRAIFYSAPQRFTQGVEKTFIANEGLLEVVVTTQKHQLNSSDVKQLNEGVGFRLFDSEAFMKKPIVVDEGGNALGARGNLNREINLIERTDGLNYTPVIRNHNTNAFNETSKIAARTYTLLNYGWDNADDSKLYPGMPVKFCYMENNKLCELKGTLIGVNVLRSRVGSTVDRDIFATKCLLSIAAEKNASLPEYDGEKSFDLQTF